MKSENIKAEANELIKSRTQVKQESLEITSFAKKLVELTKTQIHGLPLSENVLHEILKAQNMQKIALKRQIRYIGKILRSEEIETLQQAYDELFNTSQALKAKFSRLETLRDNLIDSHTSKESLNKLIQEYPDIDIQYIRQIIRNAKNEIEKENGSAKYSREIFQYIKNLTH